MAVLVAIAGGRAATAPAGGAAVRHHLRVTLSPATSLLQVSDRITVSPADGPRPDFVLNAKLRILSATPPVDEVPVGGTRAAWNGGARGESVKHYRVRTQLPPGATIAIQYEGPIDFGLSPQKDEYTRGFRETRGVVSPQGVYLAGDTAWYPQFHTTRVVFTMDAKATADGWHLVSQGTGTSRDAAGASHWESREAMEEIYLVGGPLVVFSQRAGSIDVLVYLHRREEALARRYLVTGAQYLQMYSALLGNYPYDKFALIENFWETGFGMPSFTLLGPQVIRFPFILHSSFPHEILHNWWGNSVFVDYARGNWCEGLTAYLSDHLVQQQNGGGGENRRDALQRYRDYVKEGRDFPLAEFRARDSAATEAVGYGKAMMLIHMLRRSLGDERFVAMLRRFYAEYRGQEASWADVQREAETAGGRALTWFFTQWLSRAGAPALQVRDASARAGADGGYVVRGSIAQVQAGRPYRLIVPVVVQTVGGVIARDVEVNAATATFEVPCAQAPIAVHVDPYFDVFRLLDARETPPSVGQILGEPRVLAVLPAGAAPAMMAAYRALLASWQTENHAIDIALDSEIDHLPADRAVWLFGATNALVPAAFQHPVFATAAPGRATGAAAPSRSTWTNVTIARNPSSSAKAVGWIVADDPASLPALGRKLPHYGKYSNLIFQGADATNVSATQSGDIDSPLSVDLRASPAERRSRLPRLPADSARPLAPLPAAK